jgi:hypothetical protein
MNLPVAVGCAGRREQRIRRQSAAGERLLGQAEDRGSFCCLPEHFRFRDGKGGKCLTELGSGSDLLYFHPWIAFQLSHGIFSLLMVDFEGADKVVD